MSALDRLSARERALILLVLPLILVLAGWRLGWVPLHEARAEARGEIAAYRLVAQSAARASLPGGAAPPAPADARPLAARVTAGAEAAGLALRRIEPEGERLRLTLDDVPFADVIDWIAGLEADGAATVAAVEIDRRTEPGHVSARITLEAAR